MAAKSEDKLPDNVQKLLEKKLDTIRKIRELKAESAALSVQLAKTGSRDPAVVHVMPRW